MDARYHTRPIEVGDVPEVAAIEREAFADPWSIDAVQALVGAGSVVTVTGGTVVGFVGARTVADEGEILDLAVRASHRRRGVGRQLVEAALRECQRRGAREVFLEVRETNRAARALYGKLGFEVVGRRRSYYRNPTEDALVLRRSMGPISPSQ